MSLALKQDVRTNSSGLEVWITDSTLQYAVVTNPGGWGTPNLALNQTALLAYVYQTVPSADSTTSVLQGLVPLTSAIAYNAFDIDSVQRSIGFNYNTDGHYTSVLMAIPVTVDGITTLGGHTIVSGDYYYQAGLIYHKVSSAAVPVTDYSTIIADPGVVKVVADKLFFNKLSVKKQLQYYRQYRNARDLNDPDTANTLLMKMNELEQDLAGANWDFAAGLLTVAENIVAELLEKHEIS